MFLTLFHIVITVISGVFGTRWAFYVGHAFWCPW